MPGREIVWKEKIKNILAVRDRVEIADNNYKLSAVLVPVYIHMSEYHVILTKRTNEVLHHKGQISFPGGAYNKDDSDVRVTALRETHEEIGVQPRDVEILGMLDDQTTLTTNYLITPFVGTIPYPYRFKLNKIEVAELIKVPVPELLDPRNFSPITPDNEGIVHPWGAFRYGDHHITGITSRILMQFLALAFDWCS